MTYVTILDFVGSISYPKNYFKTLTDLAFCLDTYGRPCMTVGGNAVIFKAVMEGRTYSVKCYTNLLSNDRIFEICRYLKSLSEPLVPRGEFLPDELFVPSLSTDSDWYGVYISEWEAGRTLEFEVRKALKDKDKGRLAFLASRFDDFAAELLGKEWAHGDLKPENIIVGTGGTMKLIDIDAFFVPTLAGENAIELGTSFYQHPGRTCFDYNRHIDNYSVALISASLHILSKDPSLYSKYGNRDIFLFDPAEIASGDSKAHRYAMEIAAGAGDAHTYALLQELGAYGSCRDRIGYILASRISARTDRDNAGDSAPFYALSAKRFENRWGYTNGSEEIVIEPLFSAAMEFTDELALVELGGKCHYIDTSGSIVINGSKYKACKPFRNGCAKICLHDGTWITIDREGNIKESF